MRGWGRGREERWGRLVEKGGEGEGEGCSPCINLCHVTSDSP